MILIYPHSIAKAKSTPGRFPHKQRFRSPVWKLTIRKSSTKKETNQ